MKLFQHSRTKLERSASSEELAYFLKYCFDCMYFFCLCPFRLVPTAAGSPSAQTYFAPRKWWLQSILCIISSLASLISCISNIRALNFQHSKIPSAYFRLFHSILQAPEMLLWIKLFWQNPEWLANPVNFLLNPGNKLPMLNKTATSKMKWLSAIMFMITSVASTGFAFSHHHQVFGNEFVVDLKSWWDAMIWEGRHNFFCQNSDAPIATTSLDNLDTLFGVLGIFVSFCRFECLIS